jgi:hypothetical protein
MQIAQLHKFYHIILLLQKEFNYLRGLNCNRTDLNTISGIVLLKEISMTELYTSTGPKCKYTRNKLFSDLFSKGEIHGLGLHHGELGPRTWSTGTRCVGALRSSVLGSTAKI